MDPSAQTEAVSKLGADHILHRYLVQVIDLQQANGLGLQKPITVLRRTAAGDGRDDLHVLIHRTKQSRTSALVILGQTVG